jgi:heme-degrading monooxygenase HmoA
MFVALYRWRVRPEREPDFRRAWRRLTEVIRARCGSGGSALFREPDGTFVALARWPSREAWERAFAAGSPDVEATALLRDCVLERLPHAELENVEDLWTPFPD